MPARSDRRIAEIRRMCLSLPETSEVETWGHPTFRAGSKGFAAVENVDGRPSLAVRVHPLDADAFAHDDRFFATPYGRGKWVSLWLDRPSPAAFVRQLIESAYRVVATKRMLAALKSARRSS